MLQVLDSILIFTSFWVASKIRVPVLEAIRSIGFPFDRMMINSGVDSFSESAWMLYIIVPFGPLLLELFAFYREEFRFRLGRSIWQLASAFAVLVCGVGMVAYFFELKLSSRGAMLIGAALATILVLLRKAATSYLSVQIGKNENKREPLVIVGTDHDIDAWLSHIPAERIATWRIIARYDLTEKDWASFRCLLHDKGVGRVIFVGGETEFSLLATGIEMCEVLGIESWISADFIRTQVARPAFDTISGAPMLVLRSTPELSWQLFLKMLIDRSGALLLILATLPLWIVVAIIIKIQDPGPVFYRQERAGLYGRPFRMWKFRSMVMNAEELLAQLKEAQGNQMSGPVFKLEKDPRILPFGHFIRKFSIDELPQLINVLVGEMSLVGPRPMATYEVPEIERSEHRRKMSVKPGLTCIWQVAGRNSITSFDEWVKLDLQYIDNWSLWLDIKILFQTIPAVLLARGAK